MNLLAGNASYQNKQNIVSAQNTFGDTILKNKQNLIGGISTNVLAASQGTKIEIAKLRNIKNKVKVGKKGDTIDMTHPIHEDNNLVKHQEAQERKRKKYFSILNKDTISKFEEGGKMNVIPEGALHARKHDLPDEIANQVTDKGIPVVTYDENGEITQHAEIELNEIIFNKDTTTKLEEFFKKYNDTESEEEKNNLAIECGKFLTSEILENTDDRTGLLTKEY
jgi:hypothetical protein